jgi:protein-tyrosine phosphatase
VQADVHFHLLPGVDDGPADLGESLALARAAVDDGTTIVVATPHVSLVAVQTLPEQVAALQGELDGAGIPLDVRTGGELNVNDVDECTEAELETLALGPPGRRWQLLETPFRGLGPLYQAARRLRELDYGILLAHPERCSGLWDDHAVALRHELDHGAWLQVSGASLVGAHGANVRRRASCARTRTAC